MLDKATQVKGKRKYIKCCIFFVLPSAHFMCDWTCLSLHNLWAELLSFLNYCFLVQCVLQKLWKTLKWVPVKEPFDNAGLDNYWPVRISCLLRKLLTTLWKEVQICLDPWYVLISGQSPYRHTTKVNFLTDHFPRGGEHVTPLPNEGNQQHFCCPNFMWPEQAEGVVPQPGHGGQFVQDSTEVEHLFEGWSSHWPSRDLNSSWLSKGALVFAICTAQVFSSNLTLKAEWWELLWAKAAALTGRSAPSFLAHGPTQTKLRLSSSLYPTQMCPLSV